MLAKMGPVHRSATIALFAEQIPPRRLRTLRAVLAFLHYTQIVLRVATTFCESNFVI